MEMTGERRIPAPRQRVWEALNDPEVLKASIPGCESVERVAEDQFQARVAVKLGPMSARFGGKVTLSNVDAPAGYTITGEGQGGAMGFAKGGADVALEEDGPDATVLRYQVKAQVGGKMAQLGARLIDSTAQSMANQFFDRFARQVGGEPAVAEPAEAMAAAAVPGTDTEYLADTAGLQTSPITQHGVAPATGPVGGTVSPARATPSDLTPLRLLTRDYFGLPSQFWIGGALMVVILLLLFVL
jgi:carbon monoxide dehydrogenase subunit G